MNKPLVSILTPSYNQGQWLPSNIKSVSCQSYPNVEHIVMDGGSSDDTLEILESSSDLVRWRSESDNGQADAINKAFDSSQGEIIGWLNSDDAYFSCDVVEAVVEYFNRHPEIDLVYGHSAEVNADNLLLHFVWSPPFVLMRFPTYQSLIQPSVFFRRQVAEPAFLDSTYNYAMDGEFWMRSSITYRFGRIDKVIAIDRHHTARKSEALVGEAHKEALRLRKQYGLPVEIPFRVQLTKRILQVSYRVAAVRLMVRKHDMSAFGGCVDSRRALLRRQILMRRTAMPAGTVQTGAINSTS